MSAPSVADLGALMGRAVSSEQGQAVLSIVTAMASAYTRGVGFIDGVPNGDIRAVVVAASARLLSNPSGLLRDETAGPESLGFRSAFNGWTVAERFTLDRYRAKAR